MSSPITTNANGFASIDTGATPFYLLAEKSGEKGYLKLSKGTALPVSHFDVGGENVTRGFKGFIYGERGVWRPGDDIFLTFVLEDEGAQPFEHRLHSIRRVEQIAQVCSHHARGGLGQVGQLRARHVAPGPAART